MEVIKKGSTPSVERTCNYCDAVLKVSVDDCKSEYIREFGNGVSYTCPCCGHKNWNHRTNYPQWFWFRVKDRK